MYDIRRAYDLFCVLLSELLHDIIPGEAFDRAWNIAKYEGKRQYPFNKHRMSSILCYVLRAMQGNVRQLNALGALYEWCEPHDSNN